MAIANQGKAKAATIGATKRLTVKRVPGMSKEGSENIVDESVPVTQVFAEERAVGDTVEHEDKGRSLGTNKDGMN